MPILIPDWFRRLDERSQDDTILRNRFFIRSAAMLHNPHGTLKELAEAMGVSTISLYHAYSTDRGTISPRMALLIEKTVGPDKVPARMIRPDLFA